MTFRVDFLQHRLRKRDDRISHLRLFSKLFKRGLLTDSGREYQFVLQWRLYGEYQKLMVIVVVFLSLKDSEERPFALAH